MIKTELIIAVENVEKSSKFYQKLLGCISKHGGTVFDILKDKDGRQILSLHKWGEHDHPTFNDKQNAGNGLIIYFVVDDLKPIWDNAKKLNANIENEPKLNRNSGRMEFSIRDLDNYYVSICSQKTE